MKFIFHAARALILLVDYRKQTRDDRLRMFADLRHYFKVHIWSLELDRDLTCSV